MGALLLAMTVLIGWWLSTGSARETRHGPASPVPVAAAAAAAAAASLPAPRPPSSASAPPAHLAAAPAGPLAAGWIDVCREAPIPPGGLETDPRLTQAPPTEAFGVVLRADSDPRRRAAGLALGIYAAWQAPLAQGARTLLACRGDAACERQAQASLADPRPSGVGPHLDALARLALSTDDVAVFGLAVQMCQVHDRDARGLCRQLAAAEWARRDGANLAPWLVLADGAGSDAERGA